jgi:hypothetical protein
MANISISPGSVVTSRLRMFFKSTELSLGTGFFYELSGSYYLITNWHNVSGRHPQTFKPLSTHAGLPDRMLLTASKGGSLGEWLELQLPLYSDSDSSQPQVRSGTCILRTVKKLMLWLYRLRRLPAYRYTQSIQ